MNYLELFCSFQEIDFYFSFSEEILAKSELASKVGSSFIRDGLDGILKLSDCWKFDVHSLVLI